MKYRLRKFISILAAVVFTWQGVVSAHPDASSCLRTMAFGERNDRNVLTGARWIDTFVPELVGKLVASFCMEGCIHEFSPWARDGNYAGGLGIVSTDELSGADKIGMNMWGFMPLYSKRKVQKIINGRQAFVESDINYDNEPLEDVTDAEGEPVEFDVWAIDLNNTTKDRPYHVKVKKVIKDGSPLIVFYCPEAFDFPYPPDEYDGTQRKRNRRFMQETVFGRSVFEFFKRQNFLPDVYLFNEGHVGNVVATMGDLDNFNQKAIAYVNHSIVAAALETFDMNTIDGGAEEWIRYLAFPGTRYQEFAQKFTFTRKRDGMKVIDMCVGTLRESDVACSVSTEHGATTEELFQKLFDSYGLPKYTGKIMPVLNGSSDFWIMQELLDMEKNGVVPTKEELVRIHEKGKALALNLVKERTAGMQNKEGEVMNETGIELDPNKPTAWMVRRLVEYKQQAPVLRDIIRVLCADKDKEVDTKWGKMRGLGMQVVVGGIGRDDWIEEFVEWMEDPELKGRFVFVPGGGSELLRAQAFGADICINSPLSGLEACGTSDQRTARNGGINVATRSGGPLEYIEDGKSGFLVGPYEPLFFKKPDGTEGRDDSEFASKAPKDILDKLVTCSDMYYSQGPEDTRWQDMMMESYLAAKSTVSDDAMMKRYAIGAYRLALSIKKLYFLGRKVGGLALQQAKMHKGEIKPVKITFVDPPSQKKLETISILEEILERAGVKAEIINGKAHSEPESLSFETDDIILNTDFISGGFADIERFRTLIGEGIKDAMRERPMPAAAKAQSPRETAAADIASSI
jgi:glucan phosphorylase